MTPINNAGDFAPLAPEIIADICSFLPPNSVLAFRQCSHSIKNAVDEYISYSWNLKNVAFIASMEKKLDREIAQFLVIAKINSILHPEQVLALTSLTWVLEENTKENDLAKLIQSVKV